ncbi:hypothetical protein F5Y17DRAFT_455050 [Xylariaceae sp. FL0594]|nr:hypothetical protein F5Y17DRAFT_455050 [Xylariaceae sp. FL0594]
MDAHALLTRQGWRGKGHSLHPTSDANGLTHHILVKRNQDGAGLGSKKDHKQEAWWLNAFDQALKGIDVKSGTMKQTLKGGALEKITARHAATKYTGVRGLYNSFVKGGVIEGSLVSSSESSVTATATAAAALSLPTPPDSGAGTPLVTAIGSPVGKKEKRKRSSGENTRADETKEERRARREAKRLRKAEKEARRRAAEKVEKKKAKKAERQAAKEKLKANETQEERRARRDARRKRKEEKRRLRAAKG